MIYTNTYAMKELSNHDEKRMRTHFINMKQDTSFASKIKKILTNISKQSNNVGKLRYFL